MILQDIKALFIKPARPSLMFMQHENVQSYNTNIFSSATISYNEERVVQTVSDGKNDGIKAVMGSWYEPALMNGPTLTPISTSTRLRYVLKATNTISHFISGFKVGVIKIGRLHIWWEKNWATSDPSKWYWSVSSKCGNGCFIIDAGFGGFCWLNSKCKQW